jgi:hypothetical protein
MRTAVLGASLRPLPMPCAKVPLGAAGERETEHGIAADLIIEPGGVAAGARLFEGGPDEATAVG